MYIYTYIYISIYYHYIIYKLPMFFGNPIVQNGGMTPSIATPWARSGSRGSRFSPLQCCWLRLMAAFTASLDLQLQSKNNY